jgi:hypothetical protein
MNANEQATNIEMASKIATIVNTFRRTFPEVTADLSPWLMDDGQTAKLNDTDSIDIAFHFSTYSLSCRCYSILMQLRLHRDRPQATYQAIGIEASGYDYCGQRWRFSTIGEWTFEGLTQPSTEECTKLISIFRQVLQLF